MKKNFFCVILAFSVFLSSLLLSYENVNAFDLPTAFWGTLEYSRAFWTAMNTGGAFKNGISLHSFELASRDDMQDFQTKVLLSYKAFCVWKELNKIKTENPSISEEEANSQAMTQGEQDYNSFVNNAINVNGTTKNITLKDYGYWREFCKSFTSIAKNGLGSGDISPNSRITVPLYIYQGITGVTATPQNNIGANTFVYDDKYYITSGHYTYYDKYNGTYESVSVDVGDVPTDRIRVPVVYTYDFGSGTSCQLVYLDFNRLSGSYIGANAQASENLGESNNFISNVNRFISTTDIPMCIYKDRNDFNTYRTNLENFVIQDISTPALDWQYDIDHALQTQVGVSVKEGGQEKADVVPDGYIPVKRSGLKVGEETATGVIGWDIPDTATLEGAIANPNEKEREERIATGIISVPAEDVVGADEDDTAITFPRDAAIDVPEDEDPAKEETVDDVIADQGGEFYPTQMDITEFFPFCIPFDIAYCVNKFHVSVGSAPVIHIPIVYPRALQGILGESYDVVIDFNEYVALRNVIRYFILLLFIIGLMQVTRNLIRG